MNPALRYHLSLLAFTLAACGGVLQGAQERAQLRQLLSPEEFRHAGLDKLTPEELQFLDERLSTRLANTNPRAEAARQAVPATGSVEGLPRGEAAFGAEEHLHAAIEKLQEIPSKISSRVAGVFDGWDGSTVFRLENGQVWRQVDGSRFSVYLESPTVMIEKGAMGAFYLRVEGYGSRVKVKRVK